MAELAKYTERVYLKLGVLNGGDDTDEAVVVMPVGLIGHKHDNFAQARKRRSPAKLPRFIRGESLARSS